MHPLIILYLVGVAVLLCMLLVATRMRSDYVAQKEAQYGTAILWTGLVAYCFGSWLAFLYVVVEALRER